MGFQEKADKNSTSQVPLVKAGRLACGMGGLEEAKEGPPVLSSGEGAVLWHGPQVTFP